MILFHVATQAEWQAQLTSSTFAPQGFAQEGFIHLCTKAQLAGVLDRYYKGQKGLVLLHLDDGLLMDELKYEASTNSEMFPHLYGRINKEAVVRVEEL